MACGPVAAKRCAAWWSAAHKFWASLSCFYGLHRLRYCQKTRVFRQKVHFLRIWGCLKLQAVLHNQLTATKASEKPPIASRICTSVHWVGKWRKSMPGKVNGKETAQPQWDSARYPSICMGCKSVILHQRHAAQEEVKAGNETQDFIWHVLTEYIDTLHKILWKEITCVSTGINTCPITTQLSVMALLTRGQWIYVCHLNTSSKSIKKSLRD